eukprot:Em0010g91a
MSTGLRINAKKSPTYAEFVAQEIERLGLPQDAYHLPSVALTLEEKERLDATSFSEEYSSPLHPSDFVGLWSFKPFDPNNVPNPMSGDIGVSSLLAQPPIKR